MRQNRNPLVLRTIYFAVLSAVCVIVGRASNASPRFSLKENKNCMYCHLSPYPALVDPKTGRTRSALNRRGLYYAAHSHTFAGYDEKTVMGVTAPPAFHLDWKMEMAGLPRRIAVADVAGDGTPRLITLSERLDGKPGSVLAVRKWNGTEFEIEATGDPKGPPTRMEVGRFAGATHPAVILTADALWSFSNGKLVPKPAPKTVALFGQTKLRTGKERVLVVVGKSTVKACRVDPAAADWLVDPIDPPGSKLVEWGDMHASQAFLEGQGLAQTLAVGGIVGLWDVRRLGSAFLYYINVVPMFDRATDNLDPTKHLTVQTGTYDTISFFEAADPNGVLAWTTSKLEGEPLDIATQDPRNPGKTGLLVLTANVDPRLRTLTLYALD